MQSKRQDEPSPLPEEFNYRAEAGHGEEMERAQLPIVLPVIQKMRLAPTDNVLEVGCGAGWLARRLAALVPEGRVVGMDVSDEMVRLARRAAAEAVNLLLVTGSAEDIPWQANFFTHTISVESAYYWPDPAAGLRGIWRVLAAGGSAWVLINYYRDNPHCHQWGELLGVQAQLLSAAEWMALFEDAGFGEVQQERIVDRSATPEGQTEKWFRDAQQWRAFKREGALLVHGKKPLGLRG
jgi:ubiquinone/menaquinone biosynthesis C-methylase UbiE